MNYHKKFGGITIRKVESEIPEIQGLLARRRLTLRERSSSAGLNYTICTALSIAGNYAYVGVPWSQAVDLTLPEARDLAHDTLLFHSTVQSVVISLVTVKGTLKSQHRDYYCVTPDWLWHLTGSRSGLHSHVETLQREEPGDNKNEEKGGRKRGGIRGGKRGSTRGGR